MPRKVHLKKVVILGSGPIVIGQACEFDYSGTQACKALMAEGLDVILINSNPATIMTDPEIATRVYVEPLKSAFVEKILRQEQPDAIIPTLGGQTALNLALELHANGLLRELGIELLGATPAVIRAGEDREEFRAILDRVGAQYPPSRMVRTLEDAAEAASELGFPLVLRPNYTLGGGGGGIAYSEEEYTLKIARGLHESPTSEVLVEASILGWSEFELEVMRDQSGTFVVVCSIENFDPCGVHTGDSITVAPQQTLSDSEYQAMRDEARAIIEAVGVQTGGANIQFAVHPESGRRVVIEMNPRVSRSSALASKATGFPIAKIAALLAIGYNLHEIQNDVTRSTPCCFEPALDYVVTKIPRFAFEKFAGTVDELSTQMRSVGEVMAIGRTFKESVQKALLALEENEIGAARVSFEERRLSNPNSQRIYHVFEALREGHSVADLNRQTGIQPWFLEQIETIVLGERSLSKAALTTESLWDAKRLGFSDQAIASWCGLDQAEVRRRRWENAILPRFNRVDTCAGEFESQTPYYYSTYHYNWLDEGGPAPEQVEPGMIALLGSGPNRIGQGVEFDYSCVRSVKEFQRNGHRVAMINSNPETVSTDYDTSDALFFEPITFESVLEIMRFLNPTGFVAQLGGQTPINLSRRLVEAGQTLLGSSLESIELAEDRGRFAEICRELNFKIPRSGLAGDLKQAEGIAIEIGYPVICRPSFVLGGRRMEILENAAELKTYFTRHASAISPTAPCFMDQFLEQALEVDVDLVRGPDWTIVGGIIEHIEAAGVHSGDSMGVVPPQRLRPATWRRIEELGRKLADRLNVRGFLNLQLAIKHDEIFMIEANPRSSRSVPFIAKATGVPVVDLGVKGILGLKADVVQPERYDWHKLKGVAVKGVVFPFKKFSQSDSILGPEMKSTGETMGRGPDYPEALLKALIGCDLKLPSAEEGQVFLSLRDKDKAELLPLVRSLVEMNFTLSATLGTADFLHANGLKCETVRKVHEGRPTCVDRIRSGEVAVVINTTSGRTSIEASFDIRRSCVDYSIPCITESGAAQAFLVALQKSAQGEFSVSAL